MTKEQWQAFAGFRERFRQKCTEWNACSAGWLKGLQEAASKQGGTPPYPVETPVVYNTALDAVAANDEVRLIITSDNPGKDEQLERNRKYLVGQAGKLAARFFALHPELGIDFRKNVVILNKTPIHTARTQQLKFLLKSGGENFRKLLEESELFMAEEAVAIQGAFCCPLWVIGYSELRKGGVFEPYAKALNSARASGSGGLEVGLFLFQHFSMNRFSIDLRDAPALASAENLPLAERLKVLGRAHRAEVLGW